MEKVNVVILAEEVQYRVKVKNKITSDIFYAHDAGNYSNVVAGLYSWSFALPVNGFIIPETDSLTADAKGNPIFLDSLISLEKRLPSDPAEPSNLERLEEVFNQKKTNRKILSFWRRVTP